MRIHCLIARSCSARDPRAAGLLADAHALGFSHLTGIDCHDLYFIAGELSPTDRNRLATELLCDSLAQTFCWR